MDSIPLTVLVERCVMQINLDPFFDKSSLANIRKLFRYVFQEPNRNMETIAALSGYLPAKVVETKTALDADANKRLKTKYDRYSKILAYFEGLKTKSGIL